MKSAKRWSLLLLLGLGVSVGCAQLIGADEPRELRSAIIPEDAFAPVPDASGVDAQACGANEKRCNNTCVPKTDPAFGCNNDGCDPCSMPNAATIACRESDGKCVAGTCVNGYASCNQAQLGCKFDFSDPATCGDCNVNCVGSVKPLCTPTGCGATCPINTTQCGASCVDTKTHPKYCGSCTNACVAGANGDPGCASSQCLTICRPGFAHCDGTTNGNCVALQTFYTDLDGDGFGDVNGPKKVACPGQAGPGFAAVAGDCNDNNKDVFPGQQAFFTVPYKNNANQSSYDYDCNGIEQDRATHFNGCGEGCKGAGVGPAGSGRTGESVNDYCGSTNAIACASGGVIPEDPGGANPASIHPLSSSGAALDPGCELKSSAIGANGCH